MGEDVLAGLARIEKLLQALVKATLRESMERELSDPKMRRLYQLTGEAPVAEIAKKTGFSSGKISGIWNRWEQVGLIRREGKRYQRV